MIKYLDYLDGEKIDTSLLKIGDMHLYLELGTVDKDRIIINEYFYSNTPEKVFHFQKLLKELPSNLFDHSYGLSIGKAEGRLAKIKSLGPILSQSFKDWDFLVETDFTVYHLVQGRLKKIDPDPIINDLDNIF